VEANRKPSRTTGAAPTDLLETDLAAMMPLPAAIFNLGWYNRVRLGRGYYVSIAGNDYSVDPAAIGRTVDVSADLDRVKVRLDGRVVAEHDRVWATGVTATDPTHVAAASSLRHMFAQPRAAQAGDGVPRRDLADYDKAFSLEQWAM